MTCWSTVRNLLTYVFLAGVVPMLIIALSGFIGHLLDVYIMGTGYLMAACSMIGGIAIGLGISIRLQEWFEKRFSSWYTVN